MSTLEQFGAIGRPALMGGLCTFASKTIDLTGNNQTITHPAFTFVGAVRLHSLWAEVTQALGSNVTSATFLFYANTTNFQYGSATISSFPVGSVFYYINNGIISFKSDTIRGHYYNIGSDSSAMQLNADPNYTSYIGFKYTTTNTPASGQITIYTYWEKLSANGALVNV